jgi:hypothetical protein
MLMEMLKESKSFQEKTLEQQEVLAALARSFELHPNALYLTPDELTKKLNIGNRDMWFNFLNLEPVRNFIRAEMANQSQIAQRKTFLALASAAQDGNVQAAKEINELSGIMSSADNNRIIVLHKINRPETKAKAKE